MEVDQLTRSACERLREMSTFAMVCEGEGSATFKSEPNARPQFRLKGCDNPGSGTLPNEGDPIVPPALEISARSPADTDMPYRFLRPEHRPWAECAESRSQTCASKRARPASKIPG